MLRIWEVALLQHPVDRALTILTVAMPEMPGDELLELSVGQRDAYLLTARQAAFGSQLACFTECAACHEHLELALNVEDIRLMPETENAIHRTSNSAREITIEGYEIHFRLPNSTDLALIVGCNDVLDARSLLVQRCILHVAQEGVGVEIQTLPETVITVLAEYMVECDPQAEVQLDLSCPACGYCWKMMFDIVSFFWSEICAQARRLLREVHTLARAYGWREADILSLSTARRHFYLEMVT